MLYKEGYIRDIIKHTLYLALLGKYGMTSFFNRISVSAMWQYTRQVNTSCRYTPCKNTSVSN